MALQTFTAGQVLTAAQLTTLQTNAYNQTVNNQTASYVLVASDVGKRVVMSNASATTITVNTSLFSAGDTLFIQNIGAGTCTITAGTATVTTAGSLALAQWGGGTLYFTSAGAAIFFSGGGTGYGAATGGSSSSITVGGINYTLLTFNSTSTLTVTKAGFFDFLAIGGGSGSNIRNDSARANGGGGAGAVVCGSIYLASNQTITIGAGGSYVNYGTYSIGTQTNIGAAAPFVVNAGGSVAVDAKYAQASGLGNWGNEGAASPTWSTGLGYNGGGSSASTSAGGGGGFTSAGGDGSGTTGAAGGTGFDMSNFVGSSPTPTHRATGGGGGGSVAGGAGGNSSANSNAGSTGSTPGSAAANSGSGGGGGNGTTQTTGNGGSGVCMIRFR